MINMNGSDKNIIALDIDNITNQVNNEQSFVRTSIIDVLKKIKMTEKELLITSKPTQVTSTKYVNNDTLLNQNNNLNHNHKSAFNKYVNTNSTHRKSKIIDDKLGVKDILRDKSPQLTNMQIRKPINENFQIKHKLNLNKESSVISLKSKCSRNVNITSINVTKDEYKINNITGNDDYLSILTELEDIFGNDLEKFDEHCKCFL